MKKISIIVCTILLSIPISTSQPPRKKPYLIEETTIDNILIQKLSDGSISSLCPSGTRSIILPDNTSMVKFTDGTVIEEFCHLKNIREYDLYDTKNEYEYRINKKFYITTFLSGYKKLEDCMGEITYYTSFGQVVEKYPYETIGII
jgi:hypothetical protein